MQEDARTTTSENARCSDERMESMVFAKASYISKVYLVAVTQRRLVLIHNAGIQPANVADLQFTFIYTMKTLWYNLYLHVVRYRSMYVRKSKKYQGDYHGE